MIELPFYIVDVFAEGEFTGNQLAVLRHSEKLAEAQMLKIAKEMNFSETAFIPTDEVRNEGYDVRIFTPKHELPFAGHPTLGSAYLIQREIVRSLIQTVVLNLKIGQIPVTFTYSDGRPDVLWMKQLEPSFGKTFKPREIARVLTIDEGEIDDNFIIQEVSTGLPHIIVPLRTLESVKKSKIAKETYFEFVKDKWAKGILIFCPETYNPVNQLNVRVFADYHGVPEDPATGSGNGCLAGYLLKHRYFGENRVDVRVEQGYEMGRPSLLFLRADETRGELEVSVGGRVVMVAKGELTA